jgi:uncharacterized protein YndB with AHSA1/START domain
MMKNIGSMTAATPTDREIVLTHDFDAPRNLVLDAMTKPALLQSWLFGPPGWSMMVCENDVRVGGGFRHVWRGPDGIELAMHGVYREVAAPERIVRTESFDFGCNGQSGEQVGTLVLTEEEGKTKLTLTVQYPSKEARDATIASGMEQGVAANYDGLAELLSSTPAR